MGNWLFKYQTWSVNLSRWQTVWLAAPLEWQVTVMSPVGPDGSGPEGVLMNSGSVSIPHSVTLSWQSHGLCPTCVLCGVKAHRNGFKPTWILYYCTKCLTWIGSVRVIGVVCYLSQTCFAMGLLQSRWDYQASLPDTDEFWSPAQVVDDVG